MEKLGEAIASRLVFVVCPFQGHINPMLQLATVLHSKGFSITVVHPQFNSPNPSTHPEFTFMPIPDHLTKTKIPSEDFISILKALNKNCQEPFELCMKKMLEKQEYSHDRVSCIVYDGVMHFAQIVANHLKLPAINVRTTAAATFLSFAVFPHPNGRGYKSLLDSVPDQDISHELQTLTIKEMTPSASSDALQELRANITTSIKDSLAIIINSIYDLEQAALRKIEDVFSVPIFTIGPFHKLAPSAYSSLLKEDTSCISWLDKQASKSVIYVSFGSVASMKEDELLEVACGLVNSEQPFLWVLRPGLVNKSNLVELLPENFKESVVKRGCIVEWAPQQEVLAHEAVGGFWTHCGWNSTLESVCEGVPMLCRPFLGDQHLNVRYVCHLWKVGLELESEFKREKIEKAIRKLMVDKEGEEIRHRAKEFKEKAMLCLVEGGSSHCSLNHLEEKILSSC